MANTTFDREQLRNSAKKPTRPLLSQQVYVESCTKNSPRFWKETWRCHKARAFISGEAVLGYRGLICFHQRLYSTLRNELQLHFNNHPVASRILLQQFPLHTICCAVLNHKPLRAFSAPEADAVCTWGQYADKRPRDLYPLSNQKSFLLKKIRL